MTLISHILGRAWLGCFSHVLMGFGDEGSQKLILRSLKKFFLKIFKKFIFESLNFLLDIF